MSLVTSKLQITLPKAIADKYQIRPGDEIEWVEADESIHIVPAKALPAKLDTAERLRLFDEATLRQKRRRGAAARRGEAAPKVANRGWTREEIYDRGRPR